ncbi:MAG TPA: hypothetical protein VK850_11505 [Candidatus Binatia bacterium]|nr:hypothetical protein [Candidatus Binatia bacterium]
MLRQKTHAITRIYHEFTFAESPPDVLGQTVRDGLSAAAKTFPTLKATLDHLEHFRPRRPTPTHRDLRPRK